MVCFDKVNLLNKIQFDKNDEEGFVAVYFSDISFKKTVVKFIFRELLVDFCFTERNLDERMFLTKLRD